MKTKRAELLSRWGHLRSERATWWSHWQEVTTYLLPRNGRYFQQDRNKGHRRHNSIYDNTGTRALRTLGAGMMAGATSPARPWFRLGTADPDLNKFPPVKMWLHDVTQRMQLVFQKSNTYRTLHGMYEELGAFGTAGQRCTSLGNLILHEDVYDEFMTKFMAKVEATKIGDSLVHDGVLYGPMLSEKYAKDFLTGVEMCLESGAKQIFGQGRITSDNKPANFPGTAEDGVFMWPHVFTEVTEDMKCFHEEVFGPAVTICKAKDFDHALHLANASPYGLSSAIYTNDRLEAYRFKTGIKAGMTGINNSTTGAEAHLPFGGVKGSGNGTRESGIWVIEAYSYWHAVNDELSGKLQLAQMDVEEVEMVEAQVDWNELV